MYIGVVEKREGGWALYFSHLLEGSTRITVEQLSRCASVEFVEAFHCCNLEAWVRSLVTFAISIHLL